MPVSVSQSSSPTRLSFSTNIAKEKSPAFQGALRAFNANTGASVNSSNGRDGAFAAASSSGQGGYTQMTSPRNNEGLSLQSPQAAGQSLQARKASPSHLAANLAASKAASQPKNTHEASVTSRLGRRRPSPLQNTPKDLTTSDGQHHGLSTPATKSLVQLFESKQGAPSRTQSVRYVAKPGPPIKSPKPVRPLARSNTTASHLADNLPAPLATSLSHASSNLPNASRHEAAAAASRLAEPISESARRKAPQVPPPRRRGQVGLEETDRNELRRPRTRERTQATPPSNAQPSSRDKSPKHQKSISTAFPSVPSLLPASFATKPLPEPAKPSPRLSKSLDRTPQPPAISRNPSRELPHRLSSHMSVDSLANAMVASSLASSRAPSPTKPIPLPPPPRRHHLFHRNQSQELISRTPSPAKPMRHTMRKPVDSDDEIEPRKGKSHLVRKHQHKHHEGDRKRYRTQVTERERKRYEGVWAANKGLLLPPNPDPAAPGHAVLNLVVKDIWRRSRLPDDVLEEVWELVSLQDLGRLSREEFVVGMWLIDQRLKGNKLPIKVSESVWASVRRLAGIKAPKNRR